jgi:hypothetical protein
MTQIYGGRRQTILTELDAEWGFAVRQPPNARGCSWSQLVDWPRLREMMLLARECDDDLVAEARRSLQPEEARKFELSGGQTLLGNRYATSDRVFFGENPAQEDMATFVANGCPPFQYGPIGWPYHYTRNPSVVRQFEPQCVGSWDDEPGLTGPRDLLDYPYARMCRWFFDDRADDGTLWNWIMQGTTHALAIPWRTKDEEELRDLNKKISGQLMQYSSRLANLMLNHHGPNLKWIIASGARTAELVVEFSKHLQWEQIQ